MSPRTSRASLGVLLSLLALVAPAVVGACGTSGGGAAPDVAADTESDAASPTRVTAQPSPRATTPSSSDAGTRTAPEKVAACPALAPATDQGKDAPGDPGFGCFGACGPSCDAVCVDSDVAISLDGTDENGNPTCTVCSYTVKTCKSHAFCRWHDDCYRQCDVAWLKNMPTQPIPEEPGNLCYLNCDAKVPEPCGADWTNLPVVGSPDTISPECWDGSIVKFTTATKPTATRPGACGAKPGPFVCPWPASDAMWPAGSEAAPTTLPTEGSCWYNADCPNPNTACDYADGAALPGSCIAVPGANAPNAEYAPPSTATCTVFAAADAGVDSGP